jgi:esterase/lipase superfamily enzyme
MSDAAVFFATNRNPNNPANPTDFLITDVKNTNPVRFGRADLKDVDLEPEPDDKSDAVLTDLGARAQITTAQEVVDPQAGTVTATAGLPAFAPMLVDLAGNPRDALFCVHGYDYTFRESVARATQLQYWYSQGPYGMPLLVFLFAWPSLGEPPSTTTYAEERNRARISGDAMGRALMQAAQYVSQVIDPKRIHVLAHSMGNWALRWAVQSMQSFEGGKIPPLFDQVLLAAADEDVDTLSQHDKLQPILAGCNRLSVYCNLYDWPLTASDWISGNGDRLGADGPANPQSLGKVTTISAAAVVDPVADSEQHQYYRISPYLRRDILQVLQGKADDAVEGRGNVRYGLKYVLTRAPGA